MAVGSTGGSGAGGRQADPFMAFRFRVCLDSGSPICGFSDVTGLAAETEVQTFRAGGVNDAEVQLPGPTKFSSRLVLKTGLADERRLWSWYLEVLKGAIKRKDITITIQSADSSRSVDWSFRAACPVKWTGPDLHATNSVVAFESIELIHSGLLLDGG
jgi:phage tail-like protein